jgi:hypothetical protein
LPLASGAAGSSRRTKNVPARRDYLLIAVKVCGVTGLWCLRVTEMVQSARTSIPGAKNVYCNRLSHIFAICDFTNPAKDRRKSLYGHAIATIISNGANSTQGWCEVKIRIRASRKGSKDTTHEGRLGGLAEDRAGSE